MSASYYPLKFFQSRPYARRIYRRLGELLPRITPSQSQEIALDELVPWLRANGWGAQPGRAPEMACLSQELQGALCWGDWALKGKHVTHIDKELTQAFALSKCADMRISDVLDASEKSTFYIHFEGASSLGLEISPGVAFQGAYAVLYPESLRIVLCGQSSALSALMTQWKERYDLRIAAKYFDLPAQDAVDYALADDLQDLRTAQSQLEDRNAMAGALDVQHLIARMTDGIPVFAKALALVMNALAYQRYYQSDSFTRWPHGTPERLLKQVLEGTPKEAQRNTSKLWELGFVPVNYVGEQFSQTVIRNSPPGGIRAHWREGHWRNQPHGPQFSLRKLIWLRPTLVGASSITASA